MKRQQKSNIRSLIKNFLIFIIIFLIISGVFGLLSDQTQKAQEINLNILISEIQQEKVQEIIVEQDKLTIILNDNTRQYTFKEINESLVELLANYGIAPEKIAALNIKVKSTRGKNMLVNIIIPFAIPLLILIGLIYFFSRQVKGAGMQAFKFGESRVRKLEPKDKKVKTTFKDIAGVKEAKEDLEEIVDFLKNPKKYTSLGAKIPKGVLLVGPPGCGKTLLARAVAGEANVPFFHISGSEFIEMFVGVGASRVRDLFTKAKKNLPAIIFIDELDAVGRQRGAGLGGSHDEREQTLNQILVDLDGFEPNIGLVVLAASNRPDILDPALLRPGRFDRKVMLEPPDIGDREEILKIHARGKPFDSNVNLRHVAQRTPGFTGADLENLLNEAAIFTAKLNKKKIGMNEILESIERVMLGPERKSHVLSEKEREIVAYHEAGHALVSHKLPGCDPVQKVSIISRGKAVGYTLKMPEKEKSLRNKSEFLDNIASALGGFASEKMIFKTVTTGAADDLRQATKLTRKMVTEYGMSDTLGPRTFGDKEELIFLGREISERRDYSEKVAEIIDQEVSKIINACYTKAFNLLKKNRKKLTEIAKFLLKKETLEKEEFNKLMKQ